MSKVTPISPARALTPANIYPKRPPAADAAPKQPSAAPTPKQKPRAVAATQEAAAHHHAASATVSTALATEPLSSTDVSYVASLMGVIPAQKMEEILLKTGIPIPPNLGPNIDTTA